MKKILLAALGLLLMVNTSFAAPINQIAAVVNNDVITQAQLDRKINTFKAQMKKAGAKIPGAAVLKNQILSQYIGQLLQVQAAERTGVRISNEELNTQLSHIAKGNKQSVDDLYKDAQAQGWTIKEFRNEIRQELLVQKLQERDVASRVTITQDEVNNYLNIAMNKTQSMPEYHLQAMFIALPPTPTPGQLAATKSKAAGIVAELNKGKSFAKLAATNSNDKNALKGGEMGWKKLAELPLDIANKIKAMDISSVAGPIQSSGGFYIVKLLGQRESLLPNTIEQAQAQMIFLPTSVKNGLDQLASVRQKIEGGANFTKLAKSYSQDKSAKNGGYVGWIKVGEYGAAVDAAIQQLSSGDVSQPVAGKNGYYLIKVIAKQRVTKSSAAQRRQVENLIYQRKINENIQMFVNQLRGNAYVKIFK